MLKIICSAPINMQSEKLLTELGRAGIQPIITANCIKAALEVESDKDPLGTELVQIFEKICDHNVKVSEK